MALLQCNFAKVSNLVARVNARGLCTEKNIKKSIFISQSSDVYTNLALENWLFKNFDFNNQHILLFYWNTPSITIGKHQNPWLEANIGGLNTVTENGVSLARRYSGGSTIYHDPGNLNMTFFTSRQKYNNTYNLEVIMRGVFRKFNLKMEISPKNNLTVHNINVSSIGSKIGAQNAYQNCSMLVDVNKINLMDALFKDGINVETNAIKSAKSKFLNLVEVDPKLNIDNILSAIGWEYLRTSPFSLKDGGRELASKQNGFQMVNPTEKWFPGITEMKNELQNWDWCYGKTPKFNISCSFSVPKRFTNNVNSFKSDLRVTLEVEEGKVKDVTLFIPPGLLNNGLTCEAKVITNLKGRKFTENFLKSLERDLGLSNNNYKQEKLVTDCVRQVMISI